MKLANKVAVISGAGRGIGRAIALAFAKEGAKLLLMARTTAQVEEACREAIATGTEAFAVTADISKRDDVERVVQATLDRFGPPDILVNNASISKRGLTVDFDDEEWRQVIEVNLVGSYMMTKYFLKIMLPRKTGRIINIASVAGKIAQPFSGAYGASKHAILSLTKTVAVEIGLLGAPGLTVNAICPGAVETEMLVGDEGLFAFIGRQTGESSEEIWEKRFKSQSIQGRILDPSEVAALAVFLASDEAKGITGQAINIDGGQVLY